MASLTKDNGIIKQANAAKVEQIEATAREQVKLACSAMRLAIAEASSKDNSYKANENTSKIQETLLNTIKADTKELKEEGWINGTVSTGEGKFVIIYEGDDYKNACNYNDAKITYTITLGQKSIEVTDEGTGLKDSDGNDVNIEVGGNTDAGEDTEAPELNEYGFYSDMIYSTEKDENGVQYHFVLSVNEPEYDGGAMSIFKSTTEYEGIPNDVPMKVVVYSNGKFIDYQTNNEYAILDDGKEIETEYGNAECTFNKYNRNIQYNKVYSTTSEILINNFTSTVIFRDENTIAGFYAEGSNEIEWMGSIMVRVINCGNQAAGVISMDGKKLYYYNLATGLVSIDDYYEVQ